MRRPLVAVALAVALWSSGCASAPRAATPTPGATGPSSSAAPTTGPGASGSPAPSGTQSPGGGSPGPKPGQSIPPDQQPHILIEAEVKPGCQTPGGKVALTVTTDPGARIATQTNIADPSGRPIYGDGFADDEGVWVWEFFLPATTEPAVYDILAAAIIDGKQGSTVGVKLTVPASGTCA